MPDIDIDFPWDERDNIIDYVFKKYGNHRTAMVSNQVFLKPRSTIREVSKVYGFSNEQINSITKRVRSFNFSKNLKNQVQKDSRFSRVDIDERLQNVNWETYHDDLPFNPSALSLYKWAPIADELKNLDRKIVLNSVILKWDVVKKEFAERIKF